VVVDRYHCFNFGPKQWPAARSYLPLRNGEATSLGLARCNCDRDNESAIRRGWLVFASPDARIGDPSNARAMAISDNRVRECSALDRSSAGFTGEIRNRLTVRRIAELAQVRIRKIKRASASLAAMLDTEPSPLSIESILLAALCPFHSQLYQTVNVYRDMQLGRHRASVLLGPCAKLNISDESAWANGWRQRAYTRATLRALARSTYKPNLESHLHALSLSVCIRARIMRCPPRGARLRLYAFGFHSCEMAIT